MLRITNQIHRFLPLQAFAIEPRNDDSPSVSEQDTPLSPLSPLPSESEPEAPEQPHNQPHNEPHDVELQTEPLSPLLTTPNEPLTPERSHDTTPVSRIVPTLSAPHKRDVYIVKIENKLIGYKTNWYATQRYLKQLLRRTSAQYTSWLGLRAFEWVDTSHRSIDPNIVASWTLESWLLNSLVPYRRIETRITVERVHPLV